MPRLLHRAGRVPLHGASYRIRPFHIDRAVGAEVMAGSVKIVHEWLTVRVKMLVYFAARALDSA